jgi:hypothetical protein
MVKMESFKDFFSRSSTSKQPIKIRVELNEATLAKVGNYTARKDKPHFNGDEYHGTVSLGSKEISWTLSGKRRHPNKFPITIPNDAKLAVAKVLNVDPSILEAFKIEMENGEYILLLEKA